MNFEDLMPIITAESEFRMNVPLLVFSETEMRARVGDLDRKLRREDLALFYFQLLGFYGNRTRMDLSGYLGDFRDLMDSPPPWIESQGPGAFYNHVTGETHEAWTPFWEWCFSYTFEELNKMIDGAIGFKRLYALAHAFGEEKLCQVAEFLSDWHGDLYQARPGTPDLLMWRLDPKMWFFAEIKGPKDSLRSSQIKWMAEFKDEISDDIFILKLI